MLMTQTIRSKFGTNIVRFMQVATPEAERERLDALAKVQMVKDALAAHGVTWPMFELAVRQIMNEMGGY